MHHRLSGRFGFALLALVGFLVLAVGQPVSSAAAQDPTVALSAGDYVIFSQARDGKATEISDNGSNDIQASVSGSDNSLFGRIRSNADFSSSGQNINYHYQANGPNKPVLPSTVNDGKITFRFLNENGDNFYESALSDPRHPTFTDGTWLPVQSTVPVGPVAAVSTTPPGDDYQYWPGNLHTTVTAASDYLEMDVLALEPFCDFGSLTSGQEEEWDLDGSSTEGTYCTDGGLIKLAVQDVGTLAAPRRFTFLANNGLVSISGQNAIIEPSALGMLAMSDLSSDNDQFPIKIAGSNFRVQRQSIIFAPRSGVDVSGSDGSLLCLHAIGQEVKLQGSTTDFGPAAPDCLNPGIDVVKSNSLTTDANLNGRADLGDVVTYFYTVTNTGNVALIDVDPFDDQEGPLTLTDAAADGISFLAIGASETAFSPHTITQAEVDVGSIVNVVTAIGTSEPTGTSVSDTDTNTVTSPQNPEILVVKSPSLTGDVNANGEADVGDVITYLYTVTNTGDVTLSSVSLTDDIEGAITLSDVAGDGVGVLAVGAIETGSSAHTVTQPEFDAGSLTNIATVTGQGPLGQNVQDTDTKTVGFSQNPAIQVIKAQSLTSDANLNGLPDVGDVVTYSYTVTNTGGVSLNSVALSDDVEGTITLSDVAGDGVGVLAVGASETGSSAHTVTQAEFDANILVNIATATGQGPLGQPVQDTDTQTVPFTQNPAIQVVKTQALTTDANANTLADVGDIVTYSYVVTNTGRSDQHRRRNPQLGRLSPNPPMDRDGRREDSGRG